MIRSRQMTLIEVLIASGILVVALFGLFSALVSGQSLNGLSRERTQAGLQAASRLDLVLAADWDDLPAQAGPFVVAPIEVSPGRLVKLRPVAPDTECGRVTVLDTAMPDLRQVQVRVRFRATSGGQPTTITMTGLVAKH